MIRKIQPEAGRYEYIEGAFRPSTGKLLDLLTGRQLYESHFAGVRELLQNALDAVKEQIARTQLLHHRADAQYQLSLARQSLITLRLEVRGDRYRLICRDSGVGMSKQIVKDYLLVSGESRSPELVELQLKCRAVGIPFERVGQFGIGVLSYFMLGDHVTFRTRRSAETGTVESRGWEFETWGVGSFGELRQAGIAAHGTEVEIELRPDAVVAMAERDDSSPIEFYGKLRDYVTKLIVQAPCRIELTTPVNGCKPLQVSPGWVMDEERMTQELVDWVSATLRSPQRDLALTRVELDEVRGFEEVAERHLRGVRQSIHFCSQIEGDLPEGLGKYRIILPYFTLPDKSLVYLFLKKDAGETPDQVETAFSYQGVYPSYPTIWSWHGLDCDLQAANYSQRWFPCWVNVNLTRGLDARMPVHRDTITVPGELFNQLTSIIRERIVEMHSRFLGAHSASRYARLSAMATGSDLPEGSSTHWAALSAPNVWKWAMLRYPAIAGPDMPSKVGWQGEDCSVAANLNLMYESSPGPDRMNIHAFGMRSPCHRIVLDRQGSLIPMWAVPPHYLDPKCARVWLAEFPADWRSVLGCYVSLADGRVVVLNRDHPLSTLAQNNAFEWVDRRLELGLYTRSRVADIEQLVSLIPDKKKAFDWMIACLLSAHAEFLFKIVHEDDPRLWPALWATLELDGNQTPILFHSLGWRMIERSGITGLFGRKIAKFLPKPSRHDCLECLPEKTPRKRSRSKPH